MPYGLYISAEGAMTQSTRMEVIANNLANTNTAGFKKNLAVMQARLAEAPERGLVPPGNGSLHDLGGGVRTFGTVTDFSNGPLKATGNNQDLAIRGTGFFAVQTGQGVRYTRAGNFQFDPTGTLVTEDGNQVLSTDGAPITIDPTLGPWEFSEDGAILQAGAATYLALMEPESPNDLRQAGENQFTAASPMKEVAPEQRRVASGFVEQSTVNPTTEMVDMIETSRAFEANVNMIRTQDQILGALIGRLLRAST